MPHLEAVVLAVYLAQAQSLYLAEHNTQLLLELVAPGNQERQMPLVTMDRIHQFLADQ